MIDFFELLQQTPLNVGMHFFFALILLPVVGVPLIFGVLLKTWASWMIPVIGYPMAFVLSFVVIKKCRKRKKNQNERNTLILNWLSQIELTEYYEVFIKEGYESLDDLHSITAGDLIKLKITNQAHIDKILNQIDFKRYSNKQAGEAEGASTEMTTAIATK